MKTLAPVNDIAFMTSQKETSTAKKVKHVEKIMISRAIYVIILILTSFLTQS
jgi:hypothetical protein